MSAPRSMAERVARAFDPLLWSRIDKDTQGGPFQRAANFAAEKSLKSARAAIQAMREPTRDMIAVPNTWGAKEIWESMIDVALSEGVSRET